ncbi:hypothetical protein CYLTODRAFT_370633 [Cylindrobasidium torrendii FP15055 ss-10]|uniref:Cytochrome b-c1 complex subunit 8 n=1 Tax=Cylindrobasidium torrendii FP15055 ss-10 TaxID=1314674 RepID=A0A0D7BKS9_9AGAR|nr:hypothetical protein CYLTODRAFT_370633 [Cylindrobasidium torrendii FP15055 ss-10]
MRPTLIRLSEMPGPKRAWSTWWGDKHGNFVRQKGIKSYALSSFQGKAGKNWASDYLFNGYRRISQEAVYWVVPFGFGYGIYKWANNYTEYHESKAGMLASGEAGGHGH